MKRFLCLLLCVSICSSLARPVKAATDDYLNITLADIIIAWYNASGVAIGDTNLANAIYSAYGSITINDLVEHDCLTAPDAVIAPNTPEMREYVRELIGYGNLTVPMIKVQVHHLQNYLSGLPVSDVARNSLEAMFGWDGNGYNEVMFGVLGMAIGSVANIGKIAYQCAVDTLTDISQTVQNSYLGKTLLDVYRHFTDTTYFQDLIATSDSPVVDYNVIGNVPSGYDGYGGIVGFNTYIFFLNEHVFPVLYGRDFGNRIIVWKIYNLTDKTQYVPFCDCEFDGNNIIVGNYHQQTVRANSSVEIVQYPYMDYDSSYISRPVYGYCLNKVGQAAPDMETARLEDPWGSSGQPGGSASGVTKYINNSVGNIASDNYINLSPNIGNDEYMYIFDRPTYIETLNQITNNTDNGDYSDNSTIINNFNETHIEEPSYVTVRPSTAPADPDQPAQPFISPRPTQAPDSYEGVIYEGGISEEITKKFPFCIPWDIKAMIDRLWTPESRAPYIHWDANFGSWGKLGEIDIDLQDFNGVAAIFRATTLLLWIVWLVTITRDLLG